MGKYPPAVFGSIPLDLPDPEGSRDPRFGPVWGPGPRPLIPAFDPFWGTPQIGPVWDPPTDPGSGPIEGQI